MSRHQILGIIAAIAVVGIAAIGIRFLFSGTSGEAPAASSATVQQPVSLKESPGVETEYSNTDIGFLFSVPDGLHAAEALNAFGATDVTLRDAEGKVALEVLATPAPSAPAQLTMADVTAVAPDTVASNATAVQIAPGVTGIAFEGNDPQWGGASSELWFVYKGYRYRISASKANGQLLAYVWNSWEWR